jgi:hypothetical protein
LSYYVCDLLLFTSSLVAKPAKIFRDKLSGRLQRSGVKGMRNGRPNLQQTRGHQQLSSVAKPAERPMPTRAIAVVK